MERIPASESTRKRLAELLSGEFDKSELMRQAMRLIIEEALEAEVTDALGRGYYAHGAEQGYRTGTVKSAEGPVRYAALQVADTVTPWTSEVRAALNGRTEALERLALEMYARGLPVRDIEAAFTDPTGRCVLTKSAASALTEQLWDDYQAFAGRGLASVPLLYLFVDGVAERLHPGQPREAVLAAWGIGDSGHKILLGLAPGTKEETFSCRELLRDLKARGLAEPGARGD